MDLSIPKIKFHLRKIIFIIALFSITLGVIYFVSQSSKTAIEILNSKGGKQNLWDDELSPMALEELFDLLAKAKLAGNSELIQRIQKELKRRGIRNKQKKSKIMENKYTKFDEAICDKVASQEALNFLSDKDLRDLFILEYPYFGEDNHDKIYIDFIHQNLNTNDLEKATSCLDLAIAMLFYSDTVLQQISDILQRTDDEDLMLSCLDYLLMFYDEIPTQDFIQTHQNLLLKKAPKIIEFQSNINLLLIDFEAYFLKVKQSLSDYQYPDFFYRFFNSLDNQEELQKLITPDLKSEIQNLIKTKKFQEEVEDDLLSF